MKEYGIMEIFIAGQKKDAGRGWETGNLFGVAQPQVRIKLYKLKASHMIHII